MSKRYSNKLKEQVVKEYLSGAKIMELVREYDLTDKSRVLKWRDKYLEYGGPDGRGKGSKGRPRKVDLPTMTQQEYINYLEMENYILKQLRSLSSNQLK
jgi:transposase-like protein